MAVERVYGEIPGVPEGTAFPDRAALQRAGVHRPLQGGISGGQDGADSIVVSGGYVDDVDNGDELVYTGQGGRDPGTGRQTRDQELTRGNLGLARSQQEGHPVRVIRGSGGDPRYSPTTGYRYDGLFRVVNHWQDAGKDGKKVWRFRLTKILDAGLSAAAHEPRSSQDETGEDMVPTPGAAPPPFDHEQWAADAPATQDMLKRDALAAVLAARLRRFSHHESDYSSLLHVDGPWGSGKSTLLKLLKRRLDEHYLVVPFDSWKNAKVDPPWWALLVTLRQHVSDSLPLWRRPFFRIAGAWARARRGSTPYLLTGFILLLLLGGLVLLNPAWLTVEGLGQTTKNLTTPLSALGSITLVILFVSRFVWWDSARGARRLEQVHTNPMQEVTQHFRWLLTRAPRRVIFFIDDLDRCGDRYVVDLLDAVQTLVRDSPDEKHHVGRSAYFVVAAHGNWLRRAYEAVHQPFLGAVDESGRGLGHLFLDKLFQLTVPMPALGPDTKQQYFDHVLGVQTPSQPDSEEDKELEQQIESSNSETELLEALRSAKPGQREAAAARAVERMSEPTIAEITEHALQKFAPLMDGNPRSIKRFVNTYSVLRAARTLEGITVDSDVLAFWTVLHIRWPRLTEYLETNINSVASFGSTEVRLDVMPEEYAALFEDPELMHVLDSSPVRLTPALVRACCGAAAYAEPGGAADGTTEQ